MDVKPEWSAAEIKLLTDLAAAGMTYTDISARVSALGVSRSPISIQHKSRDIGLARRNPGPVVWPGERQETLIKLWADGVSAGVIAQQLGVSRNAVMGKINRLGLARARKTTVRLSRPRKRRKAGVIPFGPVMRPMKPLPPPIIDTQIPAEQRKTLLELNEDTCRWPVGDPRSPDFFFCGAKPDSGLPYCAAHMHRSIEPRYYVRAA